MIGNAENDAIYLPHLMACRLLLLLELSMVDELVCFNAHNETWCFKGTVCSESCAAPTLQIRHVQLRLRV